MGRIEKQFLNETCSSQKAFKRSQVGAMIGEAQLRQRNFRYKGIYKRMIF